MILIHKETAEIYEMRIKSLVEPTESDHELGSYAIGELAFCSSNPSDHLGLMLADEIADHFEILGWL